MAMLARTTVLALSLAATVESLTFKDEPAAKLAQASEEWPGRRGHDHQHRRQRRHGDEESPMQTNEEQMGGRMAVLVTGSVERLLLTPLLNNVVRSNARRGVEVDLFFSLKAKMGHGEGWTPSDPKIASLVQSPEYSFASTMEHICKLARAQLASDCQWEQDADEPVANSSQRVMTDYAGAATKMVVARWRAQSRLWAKARATENKGMYGAVLVARDDAYWLAPRLVDFQGFHMDPLQISTAPCEDSAGISDKAALLGREAADVMFGSYEAWQNGDPQLEGTRTADEAWMRRATGASLNVKPEPMFAAQATFTQSGLPCFQEKTFALAEKADVEQCFGEDGINAPSASLFKSFSCDVMNPTLFELLWPQQVQRLQAAVAELARHDERSTVVLTVIDQNEVDQALNMLTSLHSTGEETSSLVIGTSTGICKALSSGMGVAGSKCLVLQPAQDVRKGVFKHAILTAAALAGLTDKLVYVSPHVTFTKPLSAQLGASDKRIVFAASSATEAKASCSEAPGDLKNIDSSVLYLSDAPEVADMLLRALARMQENEGGLSQQAAFAGALHASGNTGFGFLTCGVQLPEASAQWAAPDNKQMKMEMPMGAAKQAQQKEMKERKAAEESAHWVDRFEEQSAKEATKAADEAQRHRIWEKQASAWRDAWQERIEELQSENNYNATAVREARRKERQYRRTHKTKRVRYLPPAEAAKVKAAEEKWEADKEKQKFEDMEKAESRREEFRREVEKAQKIIDGTGSADDSAPSDGEEMNAA